MNGDQTMANAPLTGELPFWRRFMFTGFWHLTNKGWLPEYLGRINIGGDEVRGSRFVIVPFVGKFVWFDKYPCSDPECEGHNDRTYTLAEAVDDHVARLLETRREDCYCGKYRKPCSECGAYWDGLADLAEVTLNRVNVESSAP